MNARIWLTSLVLLLGFTAKSAFAHPYWLLPHEFNLSTEEGKGEWVTFDASASHTFFGFDKGVGLDQAVVYSPNGDRNRVGTYFKGHKRSVFDWYFDQSGTYKVENSRPVFHFTSYKSGKRDTPKRMMADKVAAQSRLPEGAREVSTMMIDISAMAFITNNTPTDEVLKPQAKGLAIEFLTHPSDVVQNEPVELRFLIDGEPASKIEVEITPGGTKYRDERQSISLETTETGEVSFTPEQAGPWLLMARKRVPVDLASADYKMSVRYVTFEVQPE